MEVYNKGAKYWEEVLQWAVQRRLLTYDEESILKLAANNQILSEKQSKRALEILNKVRIEGFYD